MQSYTKMNPRSFHPMHPHCQEGPPPRQSHSRQIRKLDSYALCVGGGGGDTAMCSVWQLHIFSGQVQAPTVRLYAVILNSLEHKNYPKRLKQRALRETEMGRMQGWMPKHAGFWTRPLGPAHSEVRVGRAAAQGHPAGGRGSFEPSSASKPSFSSVVRLRNSS